MQPTVKSRFKELIHHIISQSIVKEDPTQELPSHHKNNENARLYGTV